MRHLKKRSSKPNAPPPHTSCPPGPAGPTVPRSAQPLGCAPAPKISRNLFGAPMHSPSRTHESPEQAESTQSWTNPPSSGFFSPSPPHFWTMPLSQHATPNRAPHNPKTRHQAAPRDPCDPPSTSRAQSERVLAGRTAHQRTPPNALVRSGIMPGQRCSPRATSSRAQMRS